MTATKAEIIAKLKGEILPLQGVRHSLRNAALDAKLGPIKYAFPNASFPLGAMHEFIATGAEDTTATCGFVSGIIAALMKTNPALIWISSSRGIFPPALQAFGIPPDKIVFIDLQTEKEVLWAMEEALKCKGLAAVVGEIQELDFTASKRLQLAVEKSKATGFIIRKNPKSINATTCVTRWQITPAKSGLQDNMPGVGFPRWDVALLKSRNGTPGKWQVEFLSGIFRHTTILPAIPMVQKKKTG